MNASKADGFETRTLPGLRAALKSPAFNHSQRVQDETRFQRPPSILDDRLLGNADPHLAQPEGLRPSTSDEKPA